MHNVQLISVYAGSALKDIESRVSDYPSDPRFRAAYGLVLAYLSRKEEAILEGKQAVKLYPVSKDAMDGPAYIENLARIYTIVGESEVAIDELSYLLSIPCELSVPLLQVDPMWDNLRNHHAFQILIKNERGPGS
jgi:tetratricopeptide (TPR) repeat protein